MQAHYLSRYTSCFICLDVLIISSSDSSDVDMDLPLSYTSHSIQINTMKSTDPLQHAIESFRSVNVDCTIPRQLFSVCRSDGAEELQMDIFASYKNPNTNLRARPRVRFEGEEGLGTGPTREFLVLAIKIAEEGIEFSPKPVLYLEGETDHKLPIHNQGLRQTGSFQTIGRILGHSFLHDVQLYVVYLQQLNSTSRTKLGMMCPQIHFH